MGGNDEFLWVGRGSAVFEMTGLLCIRVNTLVDCKSLTKSHFCHINVQVTFRLIGDTVPSLVLTLEVSGGDGGAERFSVALPDDLPIL